MRAIRHVEWSSVWMGLSMFWLGAFMVAFCGAIVLDESQGIFRFWAVGFAVFFVGAAIGGVVDAVKALRGVA